jgi:hypothetical protein
MKTKIITHRFQNEKWGRAHLPFFKKLDKYLSNFFEIQSINYNIDGDTMSGNISLIKDTGTQFGKNPPISDVDCVIENAETGELKLISFTEYFNSYCAHITKSPNCSKVLLAHFNWQNIYYWLKRDHAINCLKKVSPWIFLPFAEFDVDFYRNKRNQLDNFEDKMFWLGSGVDAYRKMIRIIDNKGLMQPIGCKGHESYLEALINSKIGLSYYLDLDKYNTPFDHTGEFCYRDIEYTLLGLPYIRIEFKDTTYDPLLPNVHYISIPREHAYVAYAIKGDEGVADLYINRYREVIDDKEFLNYISTNQLNWANNNLMNNRKEEITFDLLNLKEWME